MFTKKGFVEWIQSLSLEEDLFLEEQEKIRKKYEDVGMELVVRRKDMKEERKVRCPGCGHELGESLSSCPVCGRKAYAHEHMLFWKEKDDGVVFFDVMYHKNYTRGYFTLSQVFGYCEKSVCCSGRLYRDTYLREVPPVRCRETDIKEILELLKNPDSDFFDMERFLYPGDEWQRKLSVFQEKASAALKELSEKKKRPKRFSGEKKEVARLIESIDLDYSQFHQEVLQEDDTTGLFLSKGRILRFPIDENGRGLRYLTNRDTGEIYESKDNFYVRYFLTEEKKLYAVYFLTCHRFSGEISTKNLYVTGEILQILRFDNDKVILYTPKFSKDRLEKIEQKDFTAKGDAFVYDSFFHRHFEQTQTEAEIFKIVEESDLNSSFVYLWKTGLFTKEKDSPCNITNNYLFYGMVPAAESLEKMGFQISHYIAEDVVCEVSGARSIYDVLGVKNRNFAKLLLQEFPKTSLEFLVMAGKLFRADQKRSAPEETIWFLQNFRVFSLKRVFRILRFVPSLRKLHEYLENVKDYQCIPYGETLEIYVDYLEMANRLKYRLKKKLLYPSSLKKEHDIACFYFNKMKETYAKEFFKKSVADYESLSYEGKEFSVIVPKEPEDLVSEGKSLHHCVKTYIDRVSDGKSQILFLRKNEEKETPFYTFEVSPQARRVVQVRGFGNCAPTKEVLEFLQEWGKENHIFVSTGDFN